MSSRLVINSVFSIAIGTLLSVMVACSSDQNNDDEDDDTGGSTASIESWCSSYCGAWQRCDHATDVSTCINSCKNNNAAILPKIRSDVVASYSQCFDTLDCATVFEGKASEECGLAASAGVAPTEKAQAFCTQAVDKANQCGGELSFGECLEYYKTYSDGTLQQATDCLARSCSDVDACMGATFGS